MSLKRFTVFESLFLATDQKIPTINKRKALFSQKLSREQVQDKLLYYFHAQMLQTFIKNESCFQINQI